MRPRFVAVLTGLLGLAGPAWAAEPPRIVVTIPPLHSLVAAVTEGVTEPALLIRGGASPHTYAMAPSDARAVQDADVLVWVGPNLEKFLSRALRNARPGRQVVTLMEEDGMLLLDTRRGGLFDAHDHDDHDEAHHDDDHGDSRHEDGHGEAHHDDEGEHGRHKDAHLWLDPANAVVAVQVVAEVLAGIDSANALRYRANADRMVTRLYRLDRDLLGVLEPVRERAYIVFHDGYQYFERRYGLASAGAITVTPDRKPGARRLRDIRTRIADTGAVCVFAEPQFFPDVIDTVIEGTNARAGMADPLGAMLEPGPTLYVELLNELARSLADCLAPHS